MQSNIKRKKEGKASYKETRGFMSNNILLLQQLPQQLQLDIFVRTHKLLNSVCCENVLNHYSKAFEPDFFSVIISKKTSLCIIS